MGSLKDDRDLAERLKSISQEEMNFLHSLAVHMSDMMNPKSGSKKIAESGLNLIETMRKLK